MLWIIEGAETDLLKSISQNCWKPSSLSEVQTCIILKVHTLTSVLHVVCVRLSMASFQVGLQKSSWVAGKLFSTTLVVRALTPQLQQFTHWRSCRIPVEMRVLIIYFLLMSCYTTGFYILKLCAALVVQCNPPTNCSHILCHMVVHQIFWWLLLSYLRLSWHTRTWWTIQPHTKSQLW